MGIFTGTLGFLHWDVAALLGCRLWVRGYDVIRQGQPSLAQVFAPPLLLPLCGCQAVQESVSAGAGMNRS